MTDKNEAARRAALERALRIAEFQIEDEEDMESCVGDLTAKAGLDTSTARIVAAALRAKDLPNVARQEGLDDSAIQTLLAGTNGSQKTADFAKDKISPAAPAAPSFGGGMDHGDVEDEDNFDATGDMHDPASESLDDEIAEHGHVPSPEEEAAEGEDVDAHQPEVADAINGQAGDVADDAFPMKDDQGSVEGLGEANDIATLQIEIPADQIEAFQQALDKALNEIMGGDESSDLMEDESASLDGGDDTGSPFPTEDEGSDASEDIDDIDAEGTDEDQPQTAGVHSMTDKTATAARAQREAILARLAGTRTASEDETNKPRDIGLGKDTTEGTYMGEKSTSIQGAEVHQPKPEDEWGTMSLEGGEGNSLRSDNPSFGSQDVPTKNPDHLGLKSGLKATTKEGGEGELEYKISFNPLNPVPNTGENVGGEFDVPTQMGAKPRNKNVVASTNDDAEEALYHLLVEAGVTEDEMKQMTFAEGVELYRSITAQRAETLAKFAGDGAEITINAEEEEGQEGQFDGTEMPQNKRNVGKKEASAEKIEAIKAELQKEAEVYKKRLKTAFGVHAKLVLAGIENIEEMETNVDLWMNDGLSAKAMLATGAQMLRMSQTAEQRVAAAHVADNSIRTAAPAQGLSINPSFAASAPNYVASELQQALKGIFTMPRIDE